MDIKEEKKKKKVRKWIRLFFPLCGTRACTMTNTMLHNVFLDFFKNSCTSWKQTFYPVSEVQQRGRKRQRKRYKMPCVISEYNNVECNNLYGPPFHQFFRKQNMKSFIFWFYHNHTSSCKTTMKQVSYRNKKKEKRQVTIPAIVFVDCFCSLILPWHHQHLFHLSKLSLLTLGRSGRRHWLVVQVSRISWRLGQGWDVFGEGLWQDHSKL